MNNDELISSLINDCNEAVHRCVSGQYIAYCKIMVEMVQKLAVLKQGVAKELKSRDDSIISLKEMLKNFGVDFIETTDEELADKLAEQRSEG